MLPCRSVTFSILVGSGTLTAVPPTGCQSAAPVNAPAQAALSAVGNRRVKNLTVRTNEDGEAAVIAVADRPGDLLIQAFLTTGTGSNAIRTFPTEDNGLGPIIITGDPLPPVAPGVASVTLTPTLTEAHIGKPVSLTATALDDSGSPMAGVKICLVSAGQAELEYYHPQRPVKSLCGVTDAQGKVTLSFTSKIPGTVGVVAAALQSGRGLVVSAPSHVMFWGHPEQEHHHDYQDRREGWWRVEEYGAAATRLAMEAPTPAIRALP